MNRIEQLDGLRGLAVIMVLVAHTPFIAGNALLHDAMFVAKKSGLGYIGVELFFILSGYLITKILIGSIKREAPGIIRTFYIKRFFRLAPVMVIAIAGCALLLPGHDYSWRVIFASNYYFSMVDDPHPLRHFWSLAVEEQFYLFWPLLLIATRLDPARVKAVFLFIVGFSVASILMRDLVLADPVSRNLIYRGLESRMIALTLGGALAFYGVPVIKARWLVLTAVTSLGIAAAAIFSAKDGGAVPLATVKAFAYLAFSASLFLLAFSEWRPVDAVLRCGALRYVGMISFGLYVYHLPVFYFFGISHMQLLDDEPAQLVTVLAAMGVTACITLASWYLIEKPMLRMKDLVIARRSGGVAHA